jgi:hypothetical protein
MLSGPCASRTASSRDIRSRPFTVTSFVRADPGGRLMYRSAVTCEFCGSDLEGRREGTRYCDVSCRSAAWHRRHPDRGHHRETPTEAEGNVYSASTDAQTNGRRRRQSRDGRGVRLYVVPEDTEARILAKVRAARGEAASRVAADAW